MKTRRWSLLTVFLSSLATVAAQTPSPSLMPSQTQQQKSPAEDDVVRITTNLVQVDAVVTDKNGKQVTDLGAEDFEILEDGKPQKITHFSYVSTGSTDSGQLVAGKPAGKEVGPAPPVQLRPDQVRRTMAIVVDDLGLSFESMSYVRSTLKKFIDQQMEPGDLVAIIRTGGGMGALQQFTSEKRQLYSAVERLKWNPMGRSGISAFTAISADSSDSSPGVMGANLNSNPGRTATEMNEFREDVYTVGTLGAINFVVRGLKDLPGRKSVLLMSDGFRLARISDQSARGSSLNTSNLGFNRSARAVDSMQRLLDVANRSSVVIYAIDARGLQTLSLTAADNVSNLSPTQIEQRLTDRRAELTDSQAGLSYLAKGTGGFSITNNNDLTGAIKRVIADQRGYYLLAYRPGDSTFDAKSGRFSFHTLSVKVKSPRLNVRYRHGFLGITDENAHLAPRTREQQLYSALNSPFASGGVHLRLTSLFSNTQKTGSFVRSLLNIEARDLAFKQDEEGWQRSNFDVLAITFGESGRIVDRISKNYSVRVRGEEYQQILRDGFVYDLSFPIRKAGAYQLRAALRDSATASVGSASQFIEVPDLGKNRLALSGIVVLGIDPSVTKKPTSKVGGNGREQPSRPAGADNPVPNAKAGPAIRQLKQGMFLQYQYIIFNAKINPATHHPSYQTLTRLFRDSQEVFRGEPFEGETTNQPDLQRILGQGAVRLGSDLSPGEYILQVVVTDRLAKEKYRTATQWIDFEIVK